MEKLLKTKFISDVHYPEWLVNVVMVPKSNGQWRMCIDFKDLNKAYPKDFFPLPKIDKMVDATARHELLTLMDAYSGYNQISRFSPDREKTSFITDKGTYYYDVMPFGLKNDGVIYQRLVTRIFKRQIGDTMKVYINNMLTKSLKARDHIKDLGRKFATLKLYNMRLNPTNVFLG